VASATKPQRKFLLAGASWIAEYGDPDDDADWAYLREYSPYHYENVEGGHGAAVDNEQAAVIWALTLEFLWRRLGPA
jgi:prolyl oligopeptidase